MNRDYLFSNVNEGLGVNVSGAKLEIYTYSATMSSQTCSYSNSVSIWLFPANLSFFFRGKPVLSPQPLPDIQLVLAGRIQGMS